MTCDEEHFLDTSPPNQIRLRKANTSPLAVSILAPLIENRWIALLLVGIGFLQLGLVFFGLPGWICPIKSALGVPCPGCGMSTAIVALIQGDLHTALSVHAFAPVFLLGILTLFVTGLLPEPYHKKIVEKIDCIEQRTGLTLALMVVLIVYWMIRLIRLA